MNILSDDIEYLYGLTDFVAAPFVVQETPTNYYIRRKHRYLHWRIVINAGAVVDNWLRVFVNGTHTGTNSPTLTGLYTWNGSHDFNSAALGTSLNNWYEVHGDVDAMTTGGAPVQWFFLESPSATPP